MEPRLPQPAGTVVPNCLQSGVGINHLRPRLLPGDPERDQMLCAHHTSPAGVCTPRVVWRHRYRLSSQSHLAVHVDYAGGYMQGPVSPT